MRLLAGARGPGGRSGLPHPDPETRERIELRSRASLGSYLLAAARGRMVDGAEAELSAAAGVNGIPLELWDVPEQRAVSPAPSTVGINLDPIRPMVFSHSIAARLGIDMPRVPSGTFATGTITQSTTAGSRAKSADSEGAFRDAGVEVLAVRGSYGTPLASKSAGTVRASMDGDDGVVEVDLPAGPDGDAVLRDVENTGAVLVRPYLDRDLSEGEGEARESPDDVLVYRKAVIRSFVVGATDAVGGWPKPELVATPGADGGGGERSTSRAGAPSAVDRGP